MRASSADLSWSYTSLACLLALVVICRKVNYKLQTNYKLPNTLNVRPNNLKARPCTLKVIRPYDLKVRPNTLNVRPINSKSRANNLKVEPYQIF